MSLKEKIIKFNESENLWIGFLRDILFVISVVVIFASISRIALGLYTPMVAVESGSMIPHIQVGDIIFVESIDRTEIITYQKGKENGYTSFGDYGDVILYAPYGKGINGPSIFRRFMCALGLTESGCTPSVTPIIHRAIYYVEKGEPMWIDGPPAPYAGYITKGDNLKTNLAYDQQGSISYLQPVKKEWVKGVARFYRVPLLGYVSLIPRKILSI